MRNLIPFIPQELVVFMFVGAGLAMIVGARRIASGLLVTALAVIFMPVLLAPLFDALPGWLLLCVIVVFGLSLLRGLFVVVIGKNSTDHMVGILMTVDAGELWNASQRGLLQPVQSKVLDKNVPANLRDPQGRWYGLSMRARTIAYNAKKVDPARLSTYEALAGPQWRGKLCLRTSKKVYNQSLVATMIKARGEPKTEQIVRGWVGNLATDVFANDTALLEAIAAGQCDVGIVNSYYYGRIVKERPEFPVKLFWANQGQGGVHVNISGAGVVTTSRKPAAATKFLEWLSAGEAQAHFAAVNMEYPANPVVAVDPVVKSWGVFEASPINIAEAGRLQPAAVQLMDRAGYR